MKSIIIFGILMFVIVDANTQTLIATSLNPDATANHNQRKIVRDSSENIYVVFTDTSNYESIIKGIKYESSTGIWNDATYLFNGKNPTLSISKNGKVHMIYESNDSLSRIMHTSTSDFLSWTPSISLSDTLIISTLAVSDIDSLGRVNIFWIEKKDTLSNTLIYASIINDTLSQRISVMTKNEIIDVAIANHLQYGNNDLFFAIQFNVDSILFLMTNNNMLGFDTLYEAIGHQPSITFNSSFDISVPENSVKFLYIDNLENLIEVENDGSGDTFYSSQLQIGAIDYVCIDDLAPPIGYSYLFMKNGNLYHGFSYGNALWGYSTILDTVINNPFNPSIAYKTFNFFNVDYVWMEEADSQFNIYYQRDPKHIWVGINDVEKDKGFSITGYPNPFSEILTIKIFAGDFTNTPQVKIYNSNSQLVNILKPVSLFEQDYEYKWSGGNLNGNKVNSGIYVITCSVGDKTTARKILFISN